MTGLKSGDLLGSMGWEACTQDRVYCLVLLLKMHLVCATCFSGYHLDNFECPINECQCVNGIAALGPDTMPCNNNATTNPNNFGTLNNPKCNAAEASLLCPNHEDLVCATCFSGYHLDNFSDA